MRSNLGRWVADADTRHVIEDLKIPAHLERLAYQDARTLDLYYALVGELFTLLRAGAADQQELAALGRALDGISRDLEGEMQFDALFFASVAFYSGGHPASAVMTMRKARRRDWDDPVQRACYELLTRERLPVSEMTSTLMRSARVGDLEALDEAVTVARASVGRALGEGPEAWVARRLYAAVVERFRSTAVRAVLPDGSAPVWTPLVDSLLDREPPVWDFFPSQIEAISAGLLTSDESFALQMPTGAGKTALTETLLFSHLSSSAGSRAVLLVPYRALARELRGTVGRHLQDMGLPCRVVYGGTVPTVAEGQGLEDSRVIIATPEAFTGLLGSVPDLVASISLVVCDEGHLLDGDSRGVSLELLLARLRARTPSPRVVFVSAIVPNVEEINSWLGGRDGTVVRSNYRPATAEFAVLRSSGEKADWNTALELHEPSSAVPAHTLGEFLRVEDFTYRSLETGRRRTLPHSSKKAVTIAAARRLLPLGTVAVFAAQKGGHSGVEGLAEELVRQVTVGLSPAPLSGIKERRRLDESVEYLCHAYGAGWIGTRSLAAGAVVHHGDLPQETREVLEEMVADRYIPLVLCTSTLAEGVNLPIRTMVLYSIERRTGPGVAATMRQRDVRNLVGRAGRAGSSTRGLVICSSPEIWTAVEPVAEGMPGEPVDGALLKLVQRLVRALGGDLRLLDNDGLEGTADLFSLVDGIDAMLIELIHDEIGAEEFFRIAGRVAAETYAAQKATQNEALVLEQVFRLRAQRLLDLREAGRMRWLQAVSARPRLVGPVVDDLYQRFSGWGSLNSPTDAVFLRCVVEWALEQPGFASDVSTAYRTAEVDVLSSLTGIIAGWIEGLEFLEISERVGLEMSLLLRVHNAVVLAAFGTLIEQAVALVEEHAEDEGEDVSPVIKAFPAFLRFGVPSAAARELMETGVRHRRAAVALGAEEAMRDSGNLLASPRSIALELLANTEGWLPRLGALIYRRTVNDLGMGRTR